MVGFLYLQLFLLLVAILRKCRKKQSPDLTAAVVLKGRKVRTPLFWGISGLTWEATVRGMNHKEQEVGRVFIGGFQLERIFFLSHTILIVLLFFISRTLALIKTNPYSQRFLTKNTGRCIIPFLQETEWTKFLHAANWSVMGLLRPLVVSVQPKRQLHMELVSTSGWKGCTTWY